MKEQGLLIVFFFTMAAGFYIRLNINAAGNVRWAKQGTGNKVTNSNTIVIL